MVNKDNWQVLPDCQCKPCHIKKGVEDVRNGRVKSLGTFSKPSRVDKLPNPSPERWDNEDWRYIDGFSNWVNHLPQPVTEELMNRVKELTHNVDCNLDEDLINEENIDSTVSGEFVLPCWVCRKNTKS